MESEKNTGMGVDGNPSHVHEIETNFIVTEEVFTAIDSSLSLQKTEDFIETYFDYNDMSEAQADIWLRLRQKDFELKIPNNDVSLKDKSFSSHTKIFTINEIANHFGLSIGSSDTTSLLQAIKNDGMNPFALFSIHRKIYIFHEYRLKISIDNVHTENDNEDSFDCITGDIEFIETDNTTPEQAINAITKFKEDFGITTTPYGKIALYLQARKPEIFTLLQSRGLW